MRGRWCRKSRQCFTHSFTPLFCVLIALFLYCVVFVQSFIIGDWKPVVCILSASPSICPRAALLICTITYWLCSLIPLWPWPLLNESPGISLRCVPVYLRNSMGIFPCGKKACGGNFPVPYYLLINPILFLSRQPILLMSSWFLLQPREAGGWRLQQTGSLWSGIKC